MQQVDQSQIVRIIAEYGRKLERLETLPQGGGGTLVSATVPYIFNKGGGVLTIGMVGEIRVFFSGTIIRWSIIANNNGNLRINVKKATYAAYATMSDIDGTDPPQLTGQFKNESTLLTGWSTSVSHGDIFRFEIDPAVTPTVVTRANVSLEIAIS